ncbi:hypothetical protein GQ53DRAFT_817730 [Thozetella sp. PMI_491]|nr:hypothetical protein GQ53DRAFT_817730 [Thozetella sp. PMI_491]
MELLKAAPSGQEHSDEEWESIRDVFILHYKTHKRPLAEVRQFLAENHGFYATPRQYKTRIIKWGASKRNRKRNPPDPLIEASDGAIQVKRNTIHVRLEFPGTVAPPPRLPPSLPPDLRVIHVATHGVVRYYSGVLHPGVDTFRVMTQGNEWNIRQFFDAANAVSALASASEWQQAQPLYGEMLDHVIPLLGERNPIVIICLIQICCRFLHQGQGAVLQRFLSFVSRMAAAQRQDSHPLRLLSSAWSQSGEQFLNLMAVSSQQAVDILSKELGPEHGQTLSARRALHTAHMARGDYAAAKSAMIPVEEVEERLFADGYSIFDTRTRLINSLLGMGSLDEAEASLNEFEKKKDAFCKVNTNPLFSHKLNLATLIWRSELLRLRNDPAAIPLLEELLEQASKNVEIRDIWIVYVTKMQLEAAREAQRTGGLPRPFFYPC